MKKAIVSFIAGVLFGLGLCVSQMVNPQKVIAFLDVSGGWDPSLAFVMAGALLVTMISFRYVLQRKSPLLDEHFSAPISQTIDTRLVTGAVIFGIGWGLAGLCPGPAITGLAFGLPKVMIFVSSMIVGMMVYQIWFNKAV